MRKRWLPHEDNVLLAWYVPYGTRSLLSLLPGRCSRAIMRRAAVLGLRRGCMGVSDDELRRRLVKARAARAEKQNARA